MNPAVLHRRHALALLAAACAGPAWPQTHGKLGAIEPRRIAPALTLRLHDGRSEGLTTLLQGHITAVQLMFTGCSSTCPIQGAIFAALQGRMTKLSPKAQLLSLSIDPLGDGPAALAAWRQRFGAGPAWSAAAPPVQHADVMLNFFSARAQSPIERHTAQVYLFDAQGRFAFTCAELAGAADIAAAMASLARGV